VHVLRAKVAKRRLQLSGVNASPRPFSSVQSNAAPTVS